MPREERRAVWLDVQVARRRVWLRALPDTTALDVWHVLQDYLASGDPIIPRRSEADPGAARPICVLCTGMGSTGLALDTKLGSAPRSSEVLHFCADEFYAEVKACGCVDVTGMENGVEVVGEKYNPVIPEFTSPPFSPTSSTLTRTNRRAPGTSRIEAS